MTRDRITAFASRVRIEVASDPDGFHGVVVCKITGKRFPDPRPYATRDAAILETRATAFAAFEKAEGTDR